MIDTGWVNSTISSSLNALTPLLLLVFVLHDVADDSESLQSAQTSVEGKVHSELLPGQSKHPGGGAVVEGRPPE